MRRLREGSGGVGQDPRIRMRLCVKDSILYRWSFFAKDFLFHAHTHPKKKTRYKKQKVLGSGALLKTGGFFLKTRNTYTPQGFSHKQVVSTHLFLQVEPTDNDRQCGDEFCM